MSNSKTSETALATASLRALSNYEINEEIRTKDTIAELFVPDDKKVFFKSTEARDSIKKSLPPGLYEYVIARTKYFDKIFLETINNEYKQIAFLGAGYDSRPYRFKNITKNLKIFELDAKPTQEYKLSILSKSNILTEGNISYISIDFEIDNFMTSLINNGYRVSDKTLFIWEGVSFYLTRKAVKNVLSLINSKSVSGSRLVFDFQTINNETDLINTGLEDETIKFGLKETEINQFLSECGFKIIEHTKASDMEYLFLRLKNGNSFGKISPIMNFILVEKT